MNIENNKMLNTIDVSSYVPPVVIRLLKRINKISFNNIALLGFGVNMRWLYRLLKEGNIDPILCDWRPRFQEYDCGVKNLVSVDTLSNINDILIVICEEEIHAMKDAMCYLHTSKVLNSIPVIYDRSLIHDPFQQEEPFKTINKKAKVRAVSMIYDDQLFDLAQFIRATGDIEGDIVEFGSLYGGSGAILAEAANFYCKDKKIWLFDSFCGIPESRYGLDYHWNNSFSDNSYKAVCDAFKDLSNVKVIQGNICETHKQITSVISFGYIASDTLESGETLLNFLWPKLSKGGIIAICDYGSYPNAIPLTMYTDKFFENRKDATIFTPARVGFFAIKK